MNAAGPDMIGIVSTFLAGPMPVSLPALALPFSAPLPLLLALLAPFA